MTVLTVLKFTVSCLHLLLLLVPASVSAQLAVTGVCDLMSSKASCRDLSEGCPPGQTLLNNVPVFTPWLCGGWLRICCVEDTSVPPINDTRCGLGDPIRRIFNGLNTSVCDWPFVVSIRGRVQSNLPLTQATTEHSCAGVIIDKYWVLTHAICLYTTNKPLREAANEFVVVAGEYNTDRVDLDPRFPYNRQLEQFVGVRRGFLHPGFARIQYLSDINLADSQQSNGDALALVKLAQPINNFCASSACLPSASPLTSSSCDTFRQCVILGWGFDTRNFQNTDGNLKQGFVKVYKNDVCDFLQTHVYTSGPARFTCSACQSSAMGQDTCLGDQGGPVLCYNGDRWSVQGIIPFNHCYKNSTNPYIIDVSPFQEWIYRVIRSNQ